MNRMKHLSRKSKVKHRTKLNRTRRLTGGQPNTPDPGNNSNINERKRRQIDILIKAVDKFEELETSEINESTLNYTKKIIALLNILYAGSKMDKDIIRKQLLEDTNKDLKGFLTVMRVAGQRGSIYSEFIKESFNFEDPYGKLIDTNDKKGSYIDNIKACMKNAGVKLTTKLDNFVGIKPPITSFFIPSRVS
jgi:hypothetical protein